MQRSLEGIEQNRSHIQFQYGQPYWFTVVYCKQFIEGI